MSIPFVVDFLEIYFLLLFIHFLGDFALQNDFVAKFKNVSLNPELTWIIVLFAHCMIHAGLVLVVCSMLNSAYAFPLALFQLVTHFVIDYSKCKGCLGTGTKAFYYDQGLHIAVMGITTAVLFL